MIEGWTGLARDGVPTSSNGIDWPVYDEAQQVIRLDWPLTVEPYIHNERCDFWDELFGY